MVEAKYQPGGYCPHCGYAMDAGCCPECGRDVPPGKLARIPSAVRLRRRLRIAAALLIVGALVAGGIYAVRSGLVYQYAPTWALLRWQGDAYSPATIALFGRYQAGTLTADQVGQMFDQSALPPVLNVRSPHPAAIPLRFSLQVARIRLPGSAFRMFSSVDIYIDGTLIQDSRLPLGSYDGTWTFRSAIPPLAPGPHTLSLDSTMFVTPVGQQAPEAAPPLHAWHFAVSSAVLVEDRQASSFVTSEGSPATAEQLRKSLQVLGFTQDAHLVFRTSTIPCNVVGFVWVRPQGAPQFLRASQVHFRSDGVSANSASINLWLLSRPEELLAAGRADVRIIPNPEEAFTSGYDDHFGDVIEARGVPVLNPGNWSTVSGVELHMYPPERLAGDPSAPLADETSPETQPTAPLNGD